MKTCKSCFGGGFNGFCSCHICNGTGVKPEQKPFDIGEHRFSDDEIRDVYFAASDEVVMINHIDECVNGLCLNKADAIAIAKALGVTGDDL